MTGTTGTTGRRTPSLVVGALALAGTATAVVPQHAATSAMLAAATVAVVGAVFALLVTAAVSGRDRPVTALDRRRGPGAPGLEPLGLRDARRDLAARPRADASLPEPLRRRLVAATVVALARCGVDVDGDHPSDPARWDERRAAAARAVLSAETWALLAGPASPTSPAHSPGPASGPARETVATVVGRALDELDSLTPAVPRRTS